VSLGSGINHYVTSVTGANGQTTTVGCALVKSTVALTIVNNNNNLVQAGDTQVKGTISESGYKVWVNGQSASPDNNGNWSAQIAPIGINGGLVMMTAIPNTENGGNGTGGGGLNNPTSTQSINAVATVQPPQGCLFLRITRT